MDKIVQHYTIYGKENYFTWLQTLCQEEIHQKNIAQHWGKNKENTVEHNP